MPTPAQIANLPEAKYSAVIPGLIAYTASSALVKTTTAYTLHSDTAIYGKDRAAPVARFSANNFLSKKSVIVPVTFDGEWVLVLTPARQALPSAAAIRRWGQRARTDSRMGAGGCAHEGSPVDAADRRCFSGTDSDY